ncbi:MAG TPA: helicase-associated domain-containing protein [Brevibacterium ravenspurgense]|nr:helicase-associated domain-containing protein [Brevibacterium ravenspurgense]
MKGFQTFTAWLSTAPADWFAEFVRTRRDLVRTDTASLARLAGSASTRKGVAVALEALNAEELQTALRAAKAARVDPVVPRSALEASSDVLDRLILLGLLWPAQTSTEDTAAGTPGDAEFFGFQSEAIALLPTSAAESTRPPEWTGYSRPDEPALTPIPESVARNAQAAAAGAAGGTVAAAVRAIEADPPSQLMSGGVGKRDVQRLASALELEYAQTIFVLELCGALNLVGVGSSSIDPVWLPTSEYDLLKRTDRGNLHAALVRAWLHMGEDITHIATGHTPRGDRVHPLGSVVKPTTANPYGGHPSALPPVRSARFRLLRTLLSPEVPLPQPSSGTTTDTSTDQKTAETPSIRLTDLTAVLQWRYPLAPAFNRETLAQMLSEAEFLGLVATPLTAPDSYGLTPLGRELAEHLSASLPAAAQPLDYAGSAATVPADFAETISELLPDYAESVVIQSDLTAVATGPVHPDLAQRLDSLADIETRGQGTVYRFTEKSIERALHAGLSRTDIVDTLRECSSTGVPQPLEFLIDGVASRLNRVQVASARGAVIVDDPDELDALLADPLLIPAQLTRVAPTVALAGISSDRLRVLLEGAGTSTLTEAPTTQPQRAPKQTAPAVTRRTARIADADLDRYITGVRSSTETADGDPASTSGILRSAIDRAQRVNVTLARADGSSTTITLTPTAITGGRVRGIRNGSEIAASLSRIISVAPAEEGTQ